MLLYAAVVCSLYVVGRPRPHCRPGDAAPAQGSPACPAKPPSHPADRIWQMWVGVEGGRPLQQQSACKELCKGDNSEIRSCTVHGAPRASSHSGPVSPETRSCKASMRGFVMAALGACDCGFCPWLAKKVHRNLERLFLVLCWATLS